MSYTSFKQAILLLAASEMLASRPGAQMGAEAIQAAGAAELPAAEVAAAAVPEAH